MESILYNTVAQFARSFKCRFAKAGNLTSAKKRNTVKGKPRPMRGGKQKSTFAIPQHGNGSHAGLTEKPCSTAMPHACRLLFIARHPRLDRNMHTFFPVGYSNQVMARKANCTFSPHRAPKKANAVAMNSATIEICRLMV